MKIILINHTPEPEKTISMAAKLCYSASDIASLGEKITQKDQGEFIAKLAAAGHYSPFEHASFTFAIEGVSRALTHQIVRHRLASFSQQSQRYVQENSFDYVIPPSVSSDPELLKIFEDEMKHDQEVYTRIVRKLNANGVTGEAANQDARYVLPNACESKIIATMNARELLHFFNVRRCNRAQWEIRNLADKMLELVREIAPNIFRKSGPNCVLSKCAEEKPCGKPRK